MPTEPVERRKAYLKRKRAGLCPRCGGKVKKSSPYKTCDTCREYYRNYQKENADTVQGLRRDRYEQRKMKYLCPRCGEKIGKKSRTTLCQKCLDKQYRYNTGAKRPRKLRDRK